MKDLKRFISNNNNNEEKEQEVELQSERFRIFKDLPFWISDVEEHKAEDIRTKGQCCFNHC